MDAGRSQSASAIPRGTRILVVDDNRDAADSLAMTLRFLGGEVRVVYDGPAALEHLASFRPAVALIDIGMPGMDGHAVARRIRSHPEFRDLPLVAITGWGQAEDLARSKSAGFDHHLVKPVGLDALQLLLTSLEGRPEARRCEDSPSAGLR
jgi:CheY-like chemotaxis protein